MFHGAYTWAAWFWRALVREWKLLKPEEAVHRLSAVEEHRPDLFAVDGLCDL